MAIRDVSLDSRRMQELKYFEVLDGLLERLWPVGLVSGCGSLGGEDARRVYGVRRRASGSDRDSQQWFRSGRTAEARITRRVLGG